MTALKTMDQDEKLKGDSTDRPPRRVLVVEDDLDMRFMLQEVLEMNHVSVTVAGDGIEAEKIASENTFDVVVSDIRIPGIDGVELARRLAKKGKPPRIILITAYPTPRTVELGYVAGAMRVLPKPFSLKEFTRLVEEVGWGSRPSA